MRKLIPTLSLAAALLSPLALVRTASAQTPPPPSSTAVITPAYSRGAGIGVGAAAFLGGGPLAAVEVAYDQPRWHMEGLFGFANPDNGPSTVRAGVRGWFHLHAGVNSDFSLGGGVGLIHVGANGGAPAATQTLIEPGMQARVFLTPNFALHGVGGIAMAFGDGNTGFSLDPQLIGNFGFTYFFI